jgi:hypothetical protein
MALAGVGQLRAERLLVRLPVGSAGKDLVERRARHR